MKNSGYYVETKSGLKGRTYHKEELVNGKVRVYCDNGSKLLCNVDSLKIVGYVN